MKEADIVRILHSRGIAMLMAVIMAAGAWFAFEHGVVSENNFDRGTVLPSANLWIADTQLALYTNVALTLLAAYGMLLLSRVFNLMRTVSQLDVTFFMVISLSAPDLLCRMNTGTPLLLILLLCIFLLYSSYANTAASPRIFLIFLLLSLGTMTQYAYMVYIPVFFLGLGQMRIFGLRTITAAILGLLTPWWIGLGAGLVTPEQVHIPQFDSLLSAIDFSDTLHVFAVVVLSSILLMSAWSMNFIKMLSYNAHLRAFTGTLSLLSLFTILAIIIDFSNIVAYAPTLFMLTAFQLCHLFVNLSRKLTAAVIGSIILIYVAIYVLIVL